MATISKNIFWSTFTSVLQLYTGSVVFIVLAKLMSVNDFGILSFGFSLNALVVIVADFGFSLMVVKDYPKLQQGKGTYLTNSILAKIILSAASSGVFFVYLILFYQGEWLIIGSLYVLFAVLASFIIYLQAILRVNNKFGAYTATNIVYAIGISFVVYAYWQWNVSLKQLVGYLLLAKSVQLLYALFLSRSTFGQFDFKTAMVVKLIKNSWSYGVFSILGIFYFMIDTQIISIYLGAKEVALYQSVFRIVLILMLFSDIVTNVLLPYLSFKFHQREDLSILVSKLYLYLLLVGCSIFLAFTSFKSELMGFLYPPAYQEALPLILPFSLVLILRTVSSLLGNILTVSNHQVYRVLAVGTSLFVSLVLNLVLIPLYGIIAAAWTSVAVHIILFGMYSLYGKREIPSLRTFTQTNLIIIAITGLIYWVLLQFSETNYGVLAGCLSLWFLVLYVIMKKDNNYIFLQQVLQEKGVG
ncbi:MAG: oligosaccharide flippase family protein, partial [Flavobacteriaceae bacterium]